MKPFGMLLLGGLLGLPFAPAQAANLVDALNLAVQNDPQLREADSRRLAAAEARPQARSLLYPQVNFGYELTREEQSGTSGFFDSSRGRIVDLSVDSTDDRDSLTLRLQQSVFRWDQWVALRQADATIAQAEADYLVAEQGLYQRVSQRYFDVLAARDSLDSTIATKEAVARQLEQAETRFEVGLIAITDVREAQAAYDTAVADEIAAKRVLGTAKELLREITGEYFDELLAPGEEFPLAPPEPQSVDNWVTSSLQQNTNIVSSRLAVDIATHTIDLRRAGHYPTLDLVLSHNDFKSENDQTIDTIASPSTTDFGTDTVQLLLNVPIYSGGGVSSRVRQAVYEQRAAKDRLDRVVRETERLTRDSYAGVVSEIARVAALKKALESSQTALEATEAGFDVGTRTTVDVLIARQNLTRARTNYLKSRYDYINNVVSLKLAAGTLQPADLEEINQWLK